MAPLAVNLARFLCGVALLAAWATALRAPGVNNLARWHGSSPRNPHSTFLADHVANPCPVRQLVRDAAASEVVPPAVSLAAGCLGGSIGVGIAYPLDTIKVKIQTYNSRALASADEDAPTGGTLGVVRQVLDQEGPGGFFAGVFPTMAGQALIKGVLFLVYDVAKQAFAPTPAGLGLAACVSGAAAGFVCTPVERLKVVMQAGYTGGPGECLREIVDEDGIDGLLARGLSATLLREIPAYFFYFTAYEAASAILDGVVPEALLPLIGGAAAGAASWVPVYPIDVVKTALQSETGAAADGGSALEITQALYKQGGFGIFWDGLSPKLVRAVVNHAVTFLVFERTCAAWLAAGF